MIPLSARFIDSLFWPDSSKKDLYLLDPKPRSLRIGPFIVYGKALARLRDRMRRGSRLVALASREEPSEWWSYAGMVLQCSVLLGVVGYIFGVGIGILLTILGVEADIFWWSITTGAVLAGLTLVGMPLLVFSPLEPLRDYLRRNLRPLSMAKDRYVPLADLEEPGLAWHVTTSTYWHPDEMLQQAELALHLMARGAWERDDELLETGKALARKVYDKTPYKVGYTPPLPKPSPTTSLALPAAASARPAADLLAEAKTLVSGEPDEVDYSDGTEIIAYPHGSHA